jgi:hypothetical protein
VKITQISLANYHRIRQLINPEIKAIKTIIFNKVKNPTYLTNSTRQCKQPLDKTCFPSACPWMISKVALPLPEWLTPELKLVLFVRLIKNLQMWRVCQILIALKSPNCYLIPKLKWDWPVWISATTLFLTKVWLLSIRIAKPNASNRTTKAKPYLTQTDKLTYCWKSLTHARLLIKLINPIVESEFKMVPQTEATPTTWPIRLEKLVATISTTSKSLAFSMTLTMKRTNNYKNFSS